MFWTSQFASYSNILQGEIQTTLDNPHSLDELVNRTFRIEADGTSTELSALGWTRLKILLTYLLKATCWLCKMLPHISSWLNRLLYLCYHHNASAVDHVREAKRRSAFTHCNLQLPVTSQKCWHHHPSSSSSSSSLSIEQNITCCNNADVWNWLLHSLLVAIYCKHSVQCFQSHQKIVFTFDISSNYKRIKEEKENA